MDAPIIYVKEGNSIVEKEAPIVERRCWWCKNPFMYEVSKPGVWVEEIMWYQCPSCEAREDEFSLNFLAGKGKRKE